MLSWTTKNKKHWGLYTKEEIPSVPVNPPEYLLNQVKGPVLDIGTGNGALAEELSKRGLKVFAIDINSDIITESSKKAVGVNYSVQDITQRLDFKDNLFDLLIIYSHKHT